MDASLALKADERRRLFEEAAGVGLYRVRREEALKRLETTLHNLERVQDIIAEIEPRLKTLERQARRANEYAAAQADLREVLQGMVRVPLESSPTGAATGAGECPDASRQGPGCP